MKSRRILRIKATLKFKFMIKELIGNFFREGKIYTTETIEVLDHDFPSLTEGGCSTCDLWLDG
jgi:hypothetical protein